MKTKAKKEPTGKTTVVFLAGVGIGSLATLLLASGPVRATRRRLEHAAGHYGHELGKKAGRILNELEATISKSGHQLEALALGTGKNGGLHLKSEWPTIKNKLRQEYNNLTDDDLAYVTGKGQDLVSRLQRKLGKSQVTIVAMLNDM